MPTMTVAPVVVSPEIDSKTASATDILSWLAVMNGIAPDSPSTNQNDTTTRKPSRSFNSRSSLRTGNHSENPSE